MIISLEFNFSLRGKKCRWFVGFQFSCGNFRKKETFFEKKKFLLKKTHERTNVFFFWIRTNKESLNKIKSQNRNSNWFRMHSTNCQIQSIGTVNKWKHEEKRVHKKNNQLIHRFDEGSSLRLNLFALLTFSLWWSLIKVNKNIAKVVENAKPKLE